jgi:dihydrofolate synthase/folylpolyglutamate synthase
MGRIALPVSFSCFSIHIVAGLMNYSEAVQYLFGLERFGWQLGLARMHAMAAELGDPQNRFRTIHVAGTNGKGSVCAMIESILRKAGLRTGLYTSPHLLDAAERIRIDGAEIKQDDFISLIIELQPLFDRHQCTFFEALTLIAFLFFYRQKVDVAVIEVGLGGRLDATNIITPLLSAITHIHYDHTEHLGRTLYEIATEKAGICKAGVSCIIGHMPQEAASVILGHKPSQKARDAVRIRHLCMTAHHSRFVMHLSPEKPLDVVLPLIGPHQVLNSCVAAAVAQASGLANAQHIIDGLAAVRWPGRFQVLHEQPLVIADVAHNVSGFRQLSWMWDHLLADKDLVMVLGILRDKDYRRMVAALPRRCHTVFAATPGCNRGLPGDELAHVIVNQRVETASSITAALEQSLSAAAASDAICVAGSHYVVAEAIPAIKTLTK